MQSLALLQSKKISRALARGASKLINFYQTFLSFDRGILMVLAPGGACRYEVPCSEYTKQQIMEHGILKGTWLGIGRIASCR